MANFGRLKIDHTHRKKFVRVSTLQRRYRAHLTWIEYSALKGWTCEWAGFLLVRGKWVTRGPGVGGGWAFTGPSSKIFEVKIGDPTAKNVARVLLLHHKNGVAYPSIRRLAAMTELSERSVNRALEFLEERGWVSRRTVPKSGGGRRNEYVLNPSILDPEPPQRGTAKMAGPVPPNLQRGTANLAQEVEVRSKKDLNGVSDPPTCFGCGELLKGHKRPLCPRTGNKRPPGATEADPLGAYAPRGFFAQ